MTAKHTPRISIITVNYNDSPGLERTLKSVQSQSFKDFEHIVVDGGSTDGSVAVIEREAHRLAYWCSEPDGGVYNGMNKGAMQARGEYLLFLNAGDTLCHPDVLQLVEPQLTGEDLVYGDLEVVPAEEGENGEGKYVKQYPDVPSLRYLLEDSLPHPATFIRREIFGNGYDTRFRIVADWHFMVQRIVFGRCSTKHIPQTVSSFMLGGISSNVEATRADRQQAYHDLFPPMIAEPIERQMLLERKEMAEVVHSIASARKLHRRVTPLLRMALKVNGLFGRRKAK